MTKRIKGYINYDLAPEKITVFALQRLDRSQVSFRYEDGEITHYDAVYKVPPSEKSGQFIFGGTIYEGGPISEPSPVDDPHTKS